jgi:LPS sulfotransferase NodH
VRAGRTGNFQDPFGLVKRMIASGSAAARSALVREALRHLLAPLDLALQPFERRRLERAGDPQLPVILIVGPPRSGSTLLGQVLTAHLPVSFPSNLTELFSRSPITATARFGWMARRRVDYRTYYGNTASLGSPNDAFSIWNRWLGTDRYHVPTRLTPELGGAMRAFFAAWGDQFEKPFMSKNNRNTAAMAALVEALPSVRFVLARRDPLFIAQSLVEARQTVQGDPRIGWGLEAEPGAGNADYLASVADQVFRIDRVIEQQLERIDRTLVFEVSYSDLCSNPHDVVGRVGDWLGLESLPTDGLEPFSLADRPRLDPAEFEQLRRALDERFSAG